MAGDLSVSLRGGSLYLPREVYDRYFPDLEAVILLRRDNDLLVMPVRHTAGGGYLLKLRNSAGDRVVDAREFFRENGFDDLERRDRAVVWDQESTALLVSSIFETAN